MGGLGRKFLHKLPDLEILRNLEAPFILWIHIDIYFLASTNYLRHVAGRRNKEAADEPHGGSPVVNLGGRSGLRASGGEWLPSILLVSA